MKTRFFLLFVAATTLLFSACKDDEKEKNGNGTKAEQLENNTLVYDGVTYKMNSYADIYHGGLTLVNSFSEDTSTNGMNKVIIDRFHISNDQVFNMWNSTIDLVNLNENEMYEISIMGEVLNLYASGTKQYSDGKIDEVEYNDESVFVSGVQKVIGNNDRTPITIIIDAVLKNGKSLQMKLYVPTENMN